MNVFASFMRTAVPLLAGVVLTVTGRLGIDVDSETAAGVVSLALTGVYYAVFRALEAAAAKVGNATLQKVAGVLLGYARPPEYKTPADPGPQSA